MATNIRRIIGEIGRSCTRIPKRVKYRTADGRVNGAIKKLSYIVQKFGEIW